MEDISKLRRLLVEMKIDRTIGTMLCATDTLITLYDKDCNLNSCVKCVFREKLEKIVFCPVRCKYIEGPRVLL